MPNKSTQVLLVVLLLWALLATSIASYLYVENQYLSREIGVIGGRYVKVNIGINYGNGTTTWYNDTLLPRGASALTALVSVAQVEYKSGTYGAYVTSVNGLQERMISNNEGYSWFWYHYDVNKKKLVAGEIAADKYKLADGDVIVWSYEHWKF